MVNLILPKQRIDNIDCVIFDKDGTLTDAHSYWGYILYLRAKKIATLYGLPESAQNEIMLAMGYSVDEECLLPTGPVALVSRNEVIECVVRFLQRRFDIFVNNDHIGIIFDEVAQEHRKGISEHVVLLPGVVELLKTLQSFNVKMGVVTSDSVVSAEAALSHAGIREFFSVVIGRESCPFTKETGVPCAKALQMLNGLGKNSLTIGDSPVDMTMADVNYMRSIGVATGQISISELSLYSPYVVGSLEDIKVEEIV